MISKGIVVLSIIFIGLLVTIVVAYYAVEKPRQDKITTETYNLSLRSYNTDENNVKTTPVSTKLIIVIDKQPNQIYQEIITEKDGYVRIEMPVNKTFKIFNENINNQTYYTQRHIYLFDNPNTNKRVDVGLESVGTLNITHQTFQNNTINLILTPNGRIRYLSFCYAWSFGITRVETSSTFEEIEPPQRLLGKIDRCYSTQRSLLNNEKTLIPLTYDIWDNSADNEINIWIIDGNIGWDTISTNNNGLDSYRIEDDNGKDVTLADIHYKLSV